MSRFATSAAESPDVMLARQWHQRLAAPECTRLEVNAEPEALKSIAAFASVVLGAGNTLLILVPDDEPLPALSTALDIAIRPLCLVLPSAEFAARIALRATISLLRSRLTRDSEDEQADAWRSQRRRIEEQETLWRNSLRWSAANDRSAWPRDVAHLFPVRILPIAAYRALSVQPADFALYYRCDVDPATQALATRQLVVGKREAAPLHRALALGDEAARLNAELAQLTRDVSDLELELATAQAELAAFTRRYCDLIVHRMTELDALRSQVAERDAQAAPQDIEMQARAEKLRHEAERSASERRKFAAAGDARAPPDDRTVADSAPFRPTPDVKRMFRHLAQKIHPDRALDETDRAWRTQLMSEANRAYRAGNMDGLLEVATLWDEGPAQRQTVTTPPNRDIVGRQVARMRHRLTEIEQELNRVFGSSLYELHAASRQAARSGRDLLDEMAAALDEQIAAARIALNILD